MRTICPCLLLIVCALLAACSGLPGGGRTSRTPDPSGSPGAPGSPERSTQPGSAGARPPAAKPGDKSAPIPDRVISLNGRCIQTEEDGFREDATLMVRNNEVQGLAWQLWVGKRGVCGLQE